MTCIQPIKAWKRKYSSLTEDSITYYKNKKIKFKKPGNAIIKDYEEIQIPCGHCIGCRLDHSNMWATRIVLETKEHAENCFITLTYNKENVPKTTSGHLSLSKRDIQNFLKKLRAQLNIKVSYFCCGEYGKTTYRPHAHLCLFGWIPKDLKKIMNSKTDNEMYTSDELAKIWGKGYVVVQELNYKTAAYTARYCMKKAGIKANKRVYTGEIEPKIKQDERNGQYFIVGHSKQITKKTDQWGREKEFLLMSKKPAIGLKYWEKYKKQIINNEGILLKVENTVQKKPIPRYFKKIWEKENWENLDKFQYVIKKQAIKNHEETLQKINAPDKEKTLLETLKNNLLSRVKFLKRDQN